MASVSNIRIEQLGSLFVWKSMAAIEANLPSKQELPHRHDYFVLMYVEKGKGTHHIDFQHYPLADHTVYFISPEQIHHLIASSPPSGEVMLFTHDFLQRYSIVPKVLFDLDLFFNCDDAPPLSIPGGQQEKLLSILRSVQTEYQAGQIHHLDIIGALLKQFLLICQRIKQSTQQTHLFRNSRKAEIVRSFKKDIETHFKSLHKVQEYADKQHLSSAYLNEVIKSESGISAKDMIQNRILREAKRLALYSDMSMKEIAWEIGFDDNAHFSKAFKKHQGETFSSFREQHLSL
ncbi:MAG: helix-turn-helix transcriptional regulator [Bacteroidota bacterium]